MLPFYLASTEGATPAAKPTQYGFLWNMASFGSFNSTDTYISWESMSTPVLDFWVTTGPGEPSGHSKNPFKSMLSQFADATGNLPLPRFPLLNPLNARTLPVFSLTRTAACCLQATRRRCPSSRPGSLQPAHPPTRATLPPTLR